MTYGKPESILKTETLHGQTRYLKSLVDTLGEKLVEISHCSFVLAHLLGHISGNDPNKGMFSSCFVRFPY
jgi:hypothetical protein